MSQAIVRGPAPAAAPSPTIVSFGLVLFATVAALVWLALEFSDPASLPIRKVRVNGEFTHLDPAVLQQAVVQSVDAGFFGLDVTAIRRQLLDQPWIRDVTIRRVWPDTLQVSVTEQTPHARWGANMALNEAGDLFAPDAAEIPGGLVRLHGPLGSEVTVLDTCRRLAAALEPLGLAVVAVELSPRHAWTVGLADGRTLVLGRKDFDQRVRRFVRGYRRSLRAVWDQVARVDMRYTNGFAVLGRAET